MEAGEIGDEMYFLVRGELTVEDAQGEVLATLGDGDFFGEIALFTGAPRTATIRATTYCDVYVLSEAAFRYMAQKYPEVHARIEAEARARFRRNPHG